MRASNTSVAPASCRSMPSNPGIRNRVLSKVRRESKPGKRVGCRPLLEPYWGWQRRRSDSAYVALVDPRMAGPEGRGLLHFGAHSEWALV